MKKPLLLVAATAVALVSATGASSRESGQRVIKVLSKTTGVKIVRDTPPTGTSKGDVIRGSSILRNAVAQFGQSKGAAVGHDRWRAVLASAMVASYRVTVTLPGGTLTCRGNDYGNGHVVLRISGGTGTFAGATGTCTATKAPSNPYGADSLNVYRISR